MGDGWLTNYQKCELYAQTVADSIHRSAGDTRSRSEIRGLLNQFKNNTELLSAQLFRSASRLTDKESARRENMIEQLRTLHRQLTQQSEKQDVASTTKNKWFDDDIPSEVQGMEYEDLREHQQQILRDQDRGLEAISTALSRQKEIGLVIGAEVEHQNVLIDDIGFHVEKVDRKLLVETSHIRKVHVKASNCGMLVVIVLLLIAIIVVACVPA